MSTGALIGALLVAAAVTGGCAMHRPSANASGLSAASDHGPGARTDGSFAATIEAQDPELSAALRGLAILANADQHRRVAERYFQLRILDAAYDHFARARDLEPSDGAAYEGLARVWREWGFAERGLGDATRAVHYSPSRPVMHNTLGRILLALGRNADARRAFERALALDPDAAYALNNLCYLSFLEGDIAGAMSHCRAALSSDPDFVAARNNLALVYAASQREDLAMHEFSATGDPAAASYNIGLVREAEGNFDTAAKAFDEASRMRPTWGAARVRAQKSHKLAAETDGARPH